MYPSGTRGSKGMHGGGLAGRGRGMTTGGRGGAAFHGATKRKVGEYQQAAKKPRGGVSAQLWQAKPIAQQPLGSYESEWYQDSYNQQWN